MAHHAEASAKESVVTPSAGEQLTSVTLRVEDGLLMAFGPGGDPVPPGFIRQVMDAGSPLQLRLENGEVVDRERALAVLDAQQRGRLSHRKNDGWVLAMLGSLGSFETTPAELIEQEPNGDLPPLPKPSRHHV